MVSYYAWHASREPGAADMIRVEFQPGSFADRSEIFVKTGPESAIEAEATRRNCSEPAQ